MCVGIITVIFIRIDFFYCTISNCDNNVKENIAVTAHILVVITQILVVGIIIIDTIPPRAIIIFT